MSAWSSGKRFYKTYTSYVESKREVQRKFEEWKILCHNESFVNNVFTFEEFANVWLNEYCKDYSPIVIKNYRCNLKNWILPKLGKYHLNDITPLVLDSFINYLKSNKNMTTGQAISNGTIKKIYAITRTILTLAYRKNLMASNPCSKIKLELRKNIGEDTLHFWDVTEYKRALALLHEEESDNAKVVEFAVKTGLRRSEIWGLTWNDIDFNNLSISVNKTLQKVNGKMCVLPCKTLSSNRTISLPESLAVFLAEYKKAHPKNVYVFENIDYDACTAWFRKWQTHSGINKIRFHDLRHTHATLLLFQGIDIKTISERLGHSNIGTTMNVYTHVLKELDSKAAQAIDKIA